MSIFNQTEFRDHEQIVFCSDATAKLRAIIAVHSTTLGPSLGGTRMWMYSSEQDALTDALRLSRGMTFKASVAGLNLGGGKAVIIGDPKKDKTNQLLQSYGKFVNGLGGKYITSKDVGIEVSDLEVIAGMTKHVTGTGHASGDPSPVTSFGVYSGMKACMKELTGSDSLRGKTIAVQGAGAVAKYLCEYLAKEGAKIFVTDIDLEKAKALATKVNGTFVAPEKIYDVEADIFCPCALGGIINNNTIPRLKVKIIAGGANNQLADEQVHSKQLIERGILFAPDYAINGGGLMSVASELNGYSHAQVMKQAEGIYDTILKIFTISKQQHIPTSQAANHLAEERLSMKRA